MVLGDIDSPLLVETDGDRIGQSRLRGKDINREAIGNAKCRRGLLRGSEVVCPDQLVRSRLPQLCDELRFIEPRQLDRRIVREIEDSVLHGLRRPPTNSQADLPGQFTGRIFNRRAESAVDCGPDPMPDSKNLVAIPLARLDHFGAMRVPIEFAASTLVKQPAPQVAVSDDLSHVRLVADRSTLRFARF